MFRKISLVALMAMVVSLFAGVNLLAFAHSDLPSWGGSYHWLSDKQPSQPANRARSIEEIRAGSFYWCFEDGKFVETVKVVSAPYRVNILDGIWYWYVNVERVWKEDGRNGKTKDALCLANYGMESDPLFDNKWKIYPYLVLDKSSTNRPWYKMPLTEFFQRLFEHLKS